MAFPHARSVLRSVQKVAAHTSSSPHETQDARWKRLANEWADLLAKQAAATHPEGLPELLAHDSQNLGDARTACVVLAKATTRWPAAAAMADRSCRPTTRAARVEVADAHASERRMRIEAKHQAARLAQEERFATHDWLQLNHIQRCALCLCQRSSTIPACPGYPAALTKWASLAAGGGGHVVLRGVLHDEATGIPPVPFLLCRVCGAWSSAAVQTQSGLLGLCKKATRAGQEVLNRVARGLHPKPQRIPAFSSISGRWNGGIRTCDSPTFPAPHSV